MSVYTKRGDRGKTSLYAAANQISKQDPRIAAYGTIDELNSQLGLVSSLLSDKTLKRTITRLQKDLFEIASELATEKGVKPAFRLAKRKTSSLEKSIDRYWSKLPALNRFVFPGGTQVAAQLHVARAVCRRAERRVVAASPPNLNILAYLNRLSDLLFTLALWVNYQAGVEEQIWSGLPRETKGIKKKPSR